MKHEIIIKNDGTAVVEINGRFYTHTLLGNNVFARFVDIDASPNCLWVARASGSCGEVAQLALLTDLTPIPNPALKWLPGTKVMVRNSNSIRWVERIFYSIDEGDILCVVPEYKLYVEAWEQCKLAEGGE